jgi:hypothetical protein
LKTLAAWAALALLLALTLGPAIARGLFWAPGDGIVMFFPQRQITAWAFAHGEIPFWNPHIFGGMPFLANMQSGVLYPGNWPGHFFSLAMATNVTVVLAYGVLIAGMWAFTSALALPVSARLVAALVFPFGGFMALHVEHIAMVHVAGLAPWLLWALERHDQTGEGRYRLVAATSVTGMVLAGHPQMMAYSLILAGAYTLWLAMARPRGERRSWLLGQLVTLGLGVGMSLMQLLPTLDLIRASQRQAIDFNWLSSYSVPPVALPGLLFGALFGSRDPFGSFSVPMWANLEWIGFLEGYVGVAALLLALVGLQSWRLQRAVRFWGVIGLLGLLLAMGHYTPLYRLWALLPVVNQMPYASRHYLEATFALAMLAAYGMAWLESGSPLARRALMRAGACLGVLMGAVIAAVGFYGPGFATRTQPFIDQAPGHPVGLDLHQALQLGQPAFWAPLVVLVLAVGLGLRPRWARVGLPLLIACDLWTFNRHQGLQFVLPAAPKQMVVSPLIDWRLGRSLAVSVERYPNCYNCDVLGYIERYHYPTLSTLHGEATVNGYDAFLPARYGRMLGMDSFGHGGESAPEVWGEAHHALDLLGLTTLRLAPAIAQQPAWQLRLQSGRWQRLPDEQGLVVLHNGRAMPHAWRVASARLLSAPAVDLAIGGHAAFAPLEEALIESNWPVGPLTPGSALASSPSLNRMRLETAGAGAGLVVLGSGYDPGWRAWAGGHELTVLRADAVLLGVLVPPGKQVIELAYEPPRWRLGLGLALASLLLLLGWLVVSARRGPPARAVGRHKIS